LQKAQLADQETASQLIADLLRDLGSLRALSDAGAQTLASIRLLALSFARLRSIHISEWDAANQAAEVWCDRSSK